MRLSFVIALSTLLVAGCAIKPEPLTTSTISDYALDKRARVVADQEVISGPVGLYEAIARAIKYNLDKRVREMELAVRSHDLRVAHYSMLPNAVASAGYDNRDNYAGGRSLEILSAKQVGPQSLTASTSSERNVRTGDMAFSWHIMDFGLSWIRAKQAADKVLIAEESRRRAVNRIVEDVRVAYWRAVSSTRMMQVLRGLEGRVEKTLADTRRLAADDGASPLTALTYERELVEISRELRNLAAELGTANAQLAALINVDPGSKFHVVLPRRMPEPRYVRLRPEAMVSVALENRSELREAAYNQRINSKEAEAAILEMLPGVSFEAGPNWNSNQYLYSNHWVAWGARASWNLMKVFSYPARRDQIEANDDLLDARALAVTMAIMTQVHVSRARLIHARRKFRAADSYVDVQRRIARQIRIALEAGKVSEQTAIREEMNYLVALVKRDLAYVDLQSAFANVHASMGRTPYEDIDPTSWTVSKLEKALRIGWRGLGDRY